MRSALNSIEEVTSVRLSPYCDVYTLTFRPGVTPTEEMVLKVFQGCAFTGRAVETVADPGALWPLPPVPEDNPTTADRISLGERLFMDKRLSRDRSTACSTCHQPERAFTNGQATAVGMALRKITRNVPTLVNVGYRRSVFWDGRTGTLEEMALGALEHPAVIDMSPEELGAFCEAKGAHPASLGALQRNLKEISRRPYVQEEASFSMIDEMVTDGLVTLENVEVMRYAPKKIDN